MEAPEFNLEKDGEWLIITNNSYNKYRQMLFEEQFVQPGYGTTGKYLVFCDEYEMLFDLAQMILIKFQLYQAKISIEKSVKSEKGFGYALCVFDFGPHLKVEISHFITDEALSTAYWDKKHPGEKYPFNYRWWKSNQSTSEGEYSHQHLESIDHKTFEGTDIESFRTGNITLKKNQSIGFVPGMPLTLADLLKD